MVTCGGSASANQRCGGGKEKIQPTTAVRFGHMRYLGEFTYPPNMPLTCGTKVVISTDRGIEIGQQVSLTCYGCDEAVSGDQMRAYAEASGGDTYRYKVGRILREATDEDLIELRHIEDGVYEKLMTCRRFAKDLGLDMKVIDCEHVFGGERIIFYFLADGRVDFRELVRRLAGEYQTRIEMRQIGARDEARLNADYETCGRECCCRGFLKTLKPVSMSMAKVQMTTLDLAKVSGRCGRLKCCLRYEHEGYSTLDKKLPKIGKRVVTKDGTGRIVDRQVLAQMIRIQTDDGKFVTVFADDIIGPDRPAPVQQGTRPEPTGQAPPAERQPPSATQAAPAQTDTASASPTRADNGQPAQASDKGESPPKRSRRSRRGRRGRRRRPRGSGGGQGSQGPAGGT
jgi:cell fate regulator YaaT (PSP1 superfamily)